MTEVHPRVLDVQNMELMLVPINPNIAAYELGTMMSTRG